MATSLTDLQKQLLLIICTIGFFTFTKQILKFIKWVWVMFIRSPKKLTNYGSWALITGCTDGIGKALASDLASDGLNLTLVGRNQLKLEAISNEILEKHGKENIETKIIVIDFAKIVGEEVEMKIKEEIEGLDVGVLVNNVGMLNSKPKFFHEVDFEEIHDLINVNLNSLTWVTRAVLPCMLKKKKGAIVNIGSGSTCAVPSFPLFALYAATKGYLAMFSRSLSVEYQQHGIDVQCQIPFLVATKMALMIRILPVPPFFIPSPEQYSKASIRCIGFEPLCVPYWTHAFQWCLSSLLPESVVNWVLFKYFVGLRRKMIQKE
ncbi:very-long-chain 3-oxoacyl-CoA reductase 1-like [Silene latifolia]|uniref:very-long-chain 3-oxoacyl-CoA reductase 1-like n=1 Tax=Silene latifolia TaxID=37657 RepID=UPI003D780D71